MQFVEGLSDRQAEYGCAVHQWKYTLSLELTAQALIVRVVRIPGRLIDGDAEQMLLNNLQSVFKNWDY